MSTVKKLRVSALAAVVVFSFSGVAWCTNEVDADAVKEHSQSRPPARPSIRKIIDVQSKAQRAVAAKELAAIERKRKWYVREWRQRVEQMNEELAAEMQRARADAALLKAVYLIDMVTDLLRKAAERRAVWEAEAERTGRGAQGEKSGSASKTRYMDEPGVRQITTKTIEVCRTREEPCRTVGVETIIKVWFAKDWKGGAFGKEDRGREAHGKETLGKIISKTLRDEFPEGVICWGDVSKCEGPSRGTDSSGVGSGEPFDGVKDPEPDGGSRVEVLGSGSKRAKARKRLAKLLWEVADWTTPIPDLIILFSGKNLITGQEEGRAGAAVSAVIGLGGPVGKVAAKGSKLVIKGGKLFFRGKVWSKGNQKIVNAVIGNIHGRTGREVFGKLSPTVGASEKFAKLGHNGIRTALSRTPFIWERHAIVRMLERRTSKLGISTPNDILSILNGGTILRAGERMIAIQSPNVGAEIIVDLGSRTVKTIRPLKPR